MLRDNEFEFEVYFYCGYPEFYSKFCKYPKGTLKSVIDADYKKYLQNIVDNSGWYIDGHEDPDKCMVRDNGYGVCYNLIET